MKNLHRPLSKVMAASLLILLAGSSGLGPVWAAKKLKDLNEPLQVELKTPLDSENSVAGSKFEAELTDDHTYKGETLPRGTVFRGRVEKARESKLFGRPGFVALGVEEAVLPDGKIIQFHPEQTPQPDQRLRHPKARTPVGIIARNLPMTIVSLGTSIPLRVATDLGAVAIPIVYGARMATGAVMELAGKDDEGRNIPQQIGYGMWRGTGIPAIVDFVGPAPEAKYAAGATVPLRVEPQGLNGLFMANSSSLGQPTSQHSAKPGVQSGHNNPSRLVPEATSPESASHPAHAIEGEDDQ